MSTFLEAFFTNYLDINKVIFSHDIVINRLFFYEQKTESHFRLIRMISLKQSFAGISIKKNYAFEGEVQKSYFQKIK